MLLERIAVAVAISLEFSLSVPEHLPSRKSNCHFGRRVYPAPPASPFWPFRVPTLGMVVAAADFSDTAPLGPLTAHADCTDEVRYPGEYQ